MSSKCQAAHKIDERSFRQEWVAAKGTSLFDLPPDRSFLIYRCGLQDLLAKALYPVKFTDPERRCIVHHDHCTATPITFPELATNQRLLDCLKKEKWLRDSFSGEEEPPRKLIIEHCIGCGRRVVKDGCKRLLRDAIAGARVQYEIVEVSACYGSAAKFDMKVVCACK